VVGVAQQQHSKAARHACETSHVVSSPFSHLPGGTMNTYFRVAGMSGVPLKFFTPDGLGFRASRWPPTAWLHAGRTAGCHRDHCDSGQHPAADAAQRSSSGEPGSMQQQHEAAVDGDVDVHPGQQGKFPAAEFFSITGAYPYGWGWANELVAQNYIKAPGLSVYKFPGDTVKKFNRNNVFRCPKGSTRTRASPARRVIIRPMRETTRRESPRTPAARRAGLALRPGIS
jgi:hypothetical protein